MVQGGERNVFTTLALTLACNCDRAGGNSMTAGAPGGSTSPGVQAQKGGQVQDATQGQVERIERVPMLIAHTRNYISDAMPIEKAIDLWLLRHGDPEMIEARLRFYSEADPRRALIEIALIEKLLSIAEAEGAQDARNPWPQNSASALRGLTTVLTLSRYVSPRYPNARRWRVEEVEKDPIGWSDDGA
jgi:hypothetical protein